MTGYGSHAFGLAKMTSSLGITSFTSKQKIENLLFHNVFWLLLHPIILTGILIAANLTPGVHIHGIIGLVATRLEFFYFVIFLQTPLLQALVRDIRLLNFLYLGVLFSSLVSAISIYLQIYRPYKKGDKSIIETE